MLKKNLFILLSLVLMTQFFTPLVLQAKNPVVLPAPGAVDGNLQLWLKANAGTSTTTPGANVSSWTEQSPNGWTASNTVDAQPTYQTDALNFNPAVRFGDSGRAELSFGSNLVQSPLGNSGLTIFAVVNPTAQPNLANFFFDVGRATGGGYGLFASAVRYGGYNSGNNTNTTTSSEAIAFHSLGEAPILLTHRTQFGSGNYLYTNSLLFASNTSTPITQLTTSNIAFASTHQMFTAPLTVGRQAKDENLTNDGGRYFRGDIAEIIVYDANINGTDRTKVESYLALKYGLTLVNTVDYLASEGTVIYPSSTTHSSYSHDIAGIGRDEDSALLQPMSRSVNPDSVVTMAGNIGTIANLEFLVWGNNNDSFTPSFETPAGSPSPVRLSREWRVAETGEVGDVNLTFDLSFISCGVDFGLPADFALLVDNDGDFSDATVIGGAVVASQTITFNNINLAHGQYFSLAYPTPSVISIANGNWENIATWDTETVPSSASVVVIEAGHTVALNSTANICELVVRPGGKLTIHSGFNLTVEDSVTNDGVLEQIKLVNNGNIPFLELRNNAGTALKYRGANINTPQNLGVVTVAVRELNNGEYCTSAGAGSPNYARRCYTITPTNSNTATVQLWARADELNGIAESNLSVYHNPTGATWTELTTGRTTGNDGAGYSFAQGSTSSFSPFLLGERLNTPTPVTITNITLNFSPYSWAYLATAGTIVLVSLLTLRLLLAKGQKSS